MNEIIKKFIQRQTCATICCVDEMGAVYCFNCFYVIDVDEALLYFKSPETTCHSALIKKNPFIAGTILPDKLNRLEIKGIQFTGIVLDAREEIQKQAALRYHSKYPAAVAVPGEMWIIQIYHIKMTDGSPGFRKKIFWDRNKEVFK